MSRVGIFSKKSCLREVRRPRPTHRREVELKWNDHSLQSVVSGRAVHHGSTPNSVITMHHKKKASIVSRNALIAIIAAPRLKAAAIWGALAAILAAAGSQVARIPQARAQAR
jgi:hypothetical protein